MRSTPRARMASARYLAKRDRRKASSPNTRGGSSNRKSESHTTPRPKEKREADARFSASAARNGPALAGTDLVDSSIIHSLPRREDALRPELDQRNHHHQDEDLGHRLVAEDLRDDAVAGADERPAGDGAAHLADAAQDHHHEGVH